jgi:Prp8 binding protein
MDLKGPPLALCSPAIMLTHLSHLHVRRSSLTLLLPLQIASLALSPSGHFLATYSLDSALIIYDVRPFSSDPMRVYRSLTGAPAGFESSLIRVAWSRHDNGARIAVGGGDRTVTVWEVESGKVLYKLPGHKGTVTGVDLHPR